MSTTPKSIRAPVELWAAVEELAARSGLKVNALVVSLMERACESGGAMVAAPVVRQPPKPRPSTGAVEVRKRTPAAPPAPDKGAVAKAALVQAEEKAAHLATPKARGDSKAPDWFKAATAGVQVGPSPVAPGSRLKPVRAMRSPTRGR